MPCTCDEWYACADCQRDPVRHAKFWLGYAERLGVPPGYRVTTKIFPLIRDLLELAEKNRHNAENAK